MGGLSAVARVGFVQTSYTVNEIDGSLDVAIQVFNPPVTESFMFVRQSGVIVNPNVTRIDIIDDDNGSFSSSFTPLIHVMILQVLKLAS
jgi:hypothetical protein